MKNAKELADFLQRKYIEILEKNLEIRDMSVICLKYENQVKTFLQDEKTRKQYIESKFIGFFVEKIGGKYDYNSVCFLEQEPEYKPIEGNSELIRYLREIKGYDVYQVNERLMLIGFEK